MLKTLFSTLITISVLKTYPHCGQNTALWEQSGIRGLPKYLNYTQFFCANFHRESNKQFNNIYLWKIPQFNTVHLQETLLAVTQSLHIIIVKVKKKIVILQNNMFVG